MNRKRKFAVLLILIGIGIPLVIYFFQENGVMFEIQNRKTIERKLTLEEIRTLEQIAEHKFIKNIAEQKIMIPVELEPIDKVINWEKYLNRGYGLVDFIKDIESIFEKDHFGKQIWITETSKSIDIPYRFVLGFGNLFTFIGISIFFFSYFPKEKRSNEEKK